MHLLIEDLNLEGGYSMQISYYKDTDSLYIDLSERKSVASIEITSGVVVDFDDKENIVGIDIDRASKILNLSKVEFSNVPLKELIAS